MITKMIYWSSTGEFEPKTELARCLTLTKLRMNFIKSVNVTNLIKMSRNMLSRGRWQRSSIRIACIIKDSRVTYKRSNFSIDSIKRRAEARMPPPGYRNCRLLRNASSCPLALNSRGTRIKWLSSKRKDKLKF